MTTPPSETTPTSAMTPDLTATSPSNTDTDAVTSPPMLPSHTPSPVATPVMTAAATEQERSSVGGETQPDGRRLKVMKRSLREGKSQSLILLSGVESEDKQNTHSKKHVSESTASFEHRLQLMLHRMGVAKTPPADTKTSQNKDEELRKTSSEGAILDKPEPPPIYMKPRTMSTSSADPRHPIHVSDPVRSDPPLHPKPFLPARPLGPLPPKPAVAAKPPLPLPTAAAPVGGGGGGVHPSCAPPSRSPAERVPPSPQAHDSTSAESPAQIEIQEHPLGAASVGSPRKEVLPASLSPWRSPSTADRSEKAQSMTDESLPKPRTRMKPLPQRRVVSVHEDALAMTQELKAVLQRSPLRFRGNRGDLPTCTEDPTSGEEMQMSEKGERASEAGKRTPEDNRNVQRDELKPERGGTTETVHLSVAQEEASASEKAPPTQDNPPALSQTPAQPLKTHTTQEKTPSAVPAPPQTLGEAPVSPLSQQKSPSRITSLETLSASPLLHKSQSMFDTQGTGETLCRQHTETTETPDQRTEPSV
ncbi:hypothetical protein LDENG_00158240 [Lucifuga dentata]|nr:hypothetical protein LDENG_00158240 [Lucifuga dentata]